MSEVTPPVNPARIHELFVQAVRLSPADQLDWLKNQTRNEPELRHRVLRLLKADRRNLGNDVLSNCDEETLQWIHGKHVQSGYIGPYRILRVIGAGSFGTVYKVALDRPVLNNQADGESNQEPSSGESEANLQRRSARPRVYAVKIMHPMKGDASIRARFVREKTALQQIRHPNVARFIGVGTHNGLPYLVMQYVQGKPLSEILLDGHGKIDNQLFPLETRLKWFRMVCHGVAAAHQQLILHRDLKPGNIIIDRKMRAILTDFGLAKFVSKRDESTQLTTAGRLMGTLPFMSPEQVNGKTRLQLSSDVYGLGAILYFLLTGRSPYQYTGFHELCHAICHLPPESPRKTDPCIPQDLETICLRCLNKLPARRYPNAEQLLSDLDRYQCGHPIQARPVGELERFSYWVRRRPAVAALSAMLLLVSLISLLVFAWLWTDASRSRDTAMQKNVQLLNTIQDLVGLLRSAEKDPTTLGLQAEMLRTIVKSFDGLALDGLLDRKSLHDAGVAWFKLGRVENQLGNMDAKMHAYRRAEDYFRRLLQDDPDNLSDSFDLFHSLISQDRNEEAFKVIQWIVDRDTTNNLYYLDALSESLRKAARSNLESGLLDQARAFSMRGMEIAQQLVEADPENCLFQRKLGHHLIFKGSLSQCDENYAEAVECFFAARQYLEVCHQSDPDDLGVFLDLANSYLYFAEMALKTGRLDEVRDSCPHFEQLSETALIKFRGYLSEGHLRYCISRYRTIAMLSSPDEADIDQ